MSNSYSSVTGVHVIDSASVVVTSECTLSFDLLTWYPTEQTLDDLSLEDDKDNVFLTIKGLKLTPLVIPYNPPLEIKGLKVATIDSGVLCLRRSKK
jgi:hypothetical protein